MLEYKYMPIKYNFSSRKGQKIKYLVIHDTGNSGVGANALNHFKFFSGGNRNASAHYFVDDHQIVQIIGDSFSAWHCGDTQGYGRALNGVRNCTSIGIELCINSDGDYQKAYANLVELVKNLMMKFNINVHFICRHYDVSRKRCPGSFFTKNLWEKFLQDVQKPIKIKLDLSKSSVGVPVQQKALDERIKYVMDEILKADRVKVNYNGKEIELRGKNIQGTNYVSIRDLAEALNLKVGWNQDKKIVELRG